MADDAALLHATIESMRDGILVLDPDGRVVFHNRRFARMLGLPEGATSTHATVAAVMAEKLERPGQTVVFADPRPGTESVVRLSLADGRVIERHVTPFFQSGPQGSVATYRDVTPQAHLEAALAEHRELLEKAQEVAHIGSWVASLDGSHTMNWSPEMCRIHGITPDEFGGTTTAARAFVHEADRDAASALAETAVLNRQPYEHEHRVVRADGVVRWVRANAHVVSNAGGTSSRLVGTLQDVTERRELEEQLRQAQKMDAIGRLAGGIAHDLNNALTAIAGFAELALGDLPPDHHVREDVTEVRKAAERAGAVTRQLLAFSRSELLESRLFNLGETVEAIGRFLGRLLGEDVILDLRIGANLPLVLGDPRQVEQAIVNLAVNARDAMPHGGRLTMSVSEAHVDEAFARGHGSITHGPHVVLRVSDTGHGMSAETRSRIFEPFFTTKPVGKGTGLGLSMVYGTLKQSNGFIVVESEPDAGSTFRLYFPRAGAAPIEKAAQAPQVAPAADHVSTVLVVDDEPSVRSLVFATLRNEGYRIVQAASGDEALELADGLGDTLDLLLTDATMPGRTGVELARELLGRRPDLPVIVMSGYTQDYLALSDLRGNVSLCQKPFTPRDLRQRVKQALKR